MTQQGSDVIDIAEMAKKIGRTESAVRAGVNREVDWLPPHFKMGRRIVWRREDFDVWLKAQARKSSKKGGKK